MQVCTSLYTIYRLLLTNTTTILYLYFYCIDDSSRIEFMYMRDDDAYISLYYI